MPRASPGRKPDAEGWRETWGEIEWGEAAPILAGCCLPVSLHLIRPEEAPGLRCPETLGGEGVMGGCGVYF